jgi:quercetin dioxygenase-like cupin family protein
MAEEPVARVTLLDAQLPATKATDHVEVRRITIVPNHAAGAHTHNGPVVGNVVAGSVVFQVDGQPAMTLRPGDAFCEPADVPIARFDAGPEGVTFIACFLLRAGEQPTLDMLPG